MLSEVVENDSYMLQLSTIAEIASLISNSDPLFKFVPTLKYCLSTVGFLEYLEESTVGYDHVNIELIVTNNVYSN